MPKTTIEWTDETWNPVRGCSRVSAGCQNCYAEKVAFRFKGDGMPYEGLLAKGGQWNGTIKLVPEVLHKPLGWKTPRKVFVNSMSDLFHENVPDAFVDQVFAVMALASQHTFQILTKRPERMQAYCSNFSFARMVENCKGEYGVSVISRHSIDQLSRIFGLLPSIGIYPRRDQWPLPNVWLGVSVEDQKTAEERIPLLMETRAAVKWLSIEPLLGPIDLINLHHTKGYGASPCEACGTETFIDCLSGDMHCESACDGPHYTHAIDWVVVGGESGVNARPMHSDWVRSLRDDCEGMGVPFLFKQWGEWVPMGQEPEFIPSNQIKKVRNILRDGSEYTEGFIKGGDLACMLKVGKTRAGRLLDGVLHDDYPACHKESANA